MPFTGLTSYHIAFRRPLRVKLCSLSISRQGLPIWQPIWQLPGFAVSASRLAALMRVLYLLEKWWIKVAWSTLQWSFLSSETRIQDMGTLSMWNGLYRVTFRLDLLDFFWRIRYIVNPVRGYYFMLWLVSVYHKSRELASSSFNSVMSGLWPSVFGSQMSRYTNNVGNKFESWIARFEWNLWGLIIMSGWAGLTQGLRSHKGPICGF